jgi:hypothetical protein
MREPFCHSRDCPFYWMRFENFAHLEQAPCSHGCRSRPQIPNIPIIAIENLAFLACLGGFGYDHSQLRPSLCHPIVYVIDHYLQGSNTPDLRETALALLVQLSEQKNSINAILLSKDYLAARALTGEDRDETMRKLSWNPGPVS